MRSIGFRAGFDLTALSQHLTSPYLISRQFSLSHQPVLKQAENKCSKLRAPTAAIELTVFRSAKYLKPRPLVFSSRQAFAFHSIEVH